MMKSGTRVIRGPAWRQENKDGGEGHLGTVVGTSSPVHVLWDNGEMSIHHEGISGPNEFDELLVYDNAPAGVKFESVSCKACVVKPPRMVFGMRWKCMECEDYDLCTPCYMNKKHDLQHTFKRFTESEQPGVTDTSSVIVGKRKGSPKKEVYGIFTGATVVRGRDWSGGDTDRGAKKKGVVKEISDWDDYSTRNKAVVVSAIGIFTERNTYTGRVGHNGKVDFKCVTAASGGYYYRDHLPVLCKLASADEGKLEVGDKVQVFREHEVLKTMQQGHGGWVDGMEKLIGKTGQVHEFTPSGDVKVLYGSGVLKLPMIYNPASIKKVPRFSLGENVRVNSDDRLVKRLQQGHGGWTDSMRSALGKVGEVLETSEDNDVQVNVCGFYWNFNAVLLERTDEPTDSGGALMGLDGGWMSDLDQLTFGKAVSGAFGDLALDAASPDASASILMSGAAKGDTRIVERMLSENKQLVNVKPFGQTALQVACHEGNVEIVIMLLSNGADTEIKDEHGDTALHYSAFGGKPKCTQELLKHDANINALNNVGCTALHIAVHTSNNDLVKVLLESNCDINTKDKNGNTPLHDAISKDTTELVELLCDMPNIDFTLKNVIGFNAYHHAALQGHLLAFDKMTQRNPELVQSKKDDGFTALHLAAANGHHELTKYLIEKSKCPVDILNNDQQTPLMLAVVIIDVIMIEYLVEHGANVNLQNSDGDTSLHISMMNVMTRRNNSMPGLLLEGLLEGLMEGLLRQLIRTGRTSPEEMRSFCLRHGIEMIEDKPGLAVACFLCQCGASQEIKNKKRQSPFEVSENGPQMKQAVQQYLSQRQESGHVSPLSLPTEDGSSPQAQLVPTPLVNVISQELSKCTITECNNEANVKFQPCGHMIVCTDCATCLIKCLSCKNTVIPAHDVHAQSSDHTAPRIERVSDLTEIILDELAIYLDAETQAVKNWRHLASHLGHDSCINTLNLVYKKDNGSPTKELLKLEATDKNCTIVDLKVILVKMKRNDALKIFEDI